eukprot:jgi/Chlat1/583/Chrsp103S01020
MGDAGAGAWRRMEEAMEAAEGLSRHLAARKEANAELAAMPIGNACSSKTSAPITTAINSIFTNNITTPIISLNHHPNDAEKPTTSFSPSSPKQTPFATASSPPLAKSPGISISPARSPPPPSSRSRQASSPPATGASALLSAHSFSDVTVRPRSPPAITDNHHQQHSPVSTVSSRRGSEPRLAEASVSPRGKAPLDEFDHVGVASDMNQYHAAAAEVGQITREPEHNPTTHQPARQSLRAMSTSPPSSPPLASPERRLRSRTHSVAPTASTPSPAPTSRAQSPRHDDVAEYLQGGSLLPPARRLRVLASLLAHCREHAYDDGLRYDVQHNNTDDDAFTQVARAAESAAAACEMVRRYPERGLLPPSFVQRCLLTDDDHDPDRIGEFQDSHAAEFWRELVQHIVFLVKSQVLGASQAAGTFAALLVPTRGGARERALARHVERYLARVIAHHTHPLTRAGDSSDNHSGSHQQPTITASDGNHTAAAAIVEQQQDKQQPQRPRAGRRGSIVNILPFEPVQPSSFTIKATSPIHEAEPVIIKPTSPAKKQTLSPRSPQPEDGLRAHTHIAATTTPLLSDSSDDEHDNKPGSRGQPAVLNRSRTWAGKGNKSTAAGRGSGNNRPFSSARLQRGGISILNSTSTGSTSGGISRVSSIISRALDGSDDDDSDA